MILAIDVHYDQNKAKVAGLLFSNWQNERADQVVIEFCEPVEEYQSGQFYKRELPCILQLLKAITTPISCIVLDGYVNLGEQQKAGLGMHLYNALDKKIPIIGVAKNQFIGTPAEAEMLRGKSQNPLYISAVGILLEEAKNHIKAMHGQYRLPTLLKEVDQECRRS